MAYYNRHFPPFVGGSEMVRHITHYEREKARDPSTPVDLTGYGISAEVWWEGGHRLSPSIEIGDLAAGEPHYVLTLNEGQTAQIPLGRVAFANLILLPPNGVTEIYGPIWLERTA